MLKARGPGRSVTCACNNPGGGKFYRHNHARLLAWLRCYSDFHDSGFSGGVPDFREMEDYGARSPLNNHRLRRLDDEELYRCHRVLLEAVGELRRERLVLYEGLLPVYFGDDPNPILPCGWREAASESPTAWLALVNHNEAVEFMHAHVEQELSQSDLERLEVVAPWWPPVAPWPISSLSEDVLEAYYGHLEFDDAPVAARKAAEETRCAVESVHAVIRQAEEGVDPTPLAQSYYAAKGSLRVDAIKLRALRHERDLSQSALNRKSGVSQMTIWSLESGKRKALPQTIKKLADALGVETTELLQRKET